MRKKLNLKATLLLIPFVFIISACSDDESYNTSKLEFPPQALYTWDESYHPNYIQKHTRGIINEAYEFVPSGLSQVYPGLVIKGNTIDRPPIYPTALNIKKDSIDVSFDMPGYYGERIYPGRIHYSKALNKALHSPDFSGEQTGLFEYDLKQFYDYSELRLAFGSNINIAQILKINGSHDHQRIHHKSGLFARVYQRNFTAMMDYPEDGNLFLDNENITKYKNDAYINSIAYGRLAIIAIESDCSYDSLKTAFKLSLNINKFGIKGSLDEQSKRILEKAETHVYILGGSGSGAAQVFQDFGKFHEFIVKGGTFSPSIPGVPIYVTANRLDDNSIWVTHFEMPSNF